MQLSILSNCSLTCFSPTNPLTSESIFSFALSRFRRSGRVIESSLSSCCCWSSESDVDGDVSSEVSSESDEAEGGRRGGCIESTRIKGYASKYRDSVKVCKVGACSLCTYIDRRVGTKCQLPNKLHPVSDDMACMWHTNNPKSYSRHLRQLLSRGATPCQQAHIEVHTHGTFLSLGHEYLSLQTN